jgi:hypothetical protein
MCILQEYLESLNEEMYGQIFYKIICTNIAYNTLKYKNSGQYILKE